MKRVCDIILEYLIGRVQKSKKPMDNQIARVSDGHQEEEKKCIPGETLRGCFD
jgi:hypothetical protein